MQLYLIRHAHALAEEIDPDRPLSPKGRAQIKKLARFLQAKSAFAPAELWHSPLARSRQTARLLAGAVCPSAKVSEIPHLEPEAKPSTIAARLKTFRRDLAIVGHEPHLSSLASLLVTGTVRADVFKIRKSAVLCLDRSGPQTAFWRVRWLLAPELLD